MNRKIIVVASICLLSTLGVFSQGNIVDLGVNVQKSELSAVDIDGDGDRDLIIVGENPDGRFAQVILNDGEFNFSPMEYPFVGAALTTMDWGDVNGDGNLDAVQSGFAADSIVTNLFVSDSEGNWSVDLAMGDFQHMSPSMGIADLNNDGYTDVYVFGNHFEGKPQIYFNDQEGGFAASAQFEDYQFIDPYVSVVDIDVDGDLDLFVMAGYEVNIDARFARIFYNEEGTFTESDPEITAKGFGHAEWGDFDSDGDLDLLLNGDGWVNSGEDNDNIVRLYENDGGEFTEATTFTTYRQINIGDGTRFADWDNDGDLDVIITGWNQDAGRQATAIYLNNAGSFTEADVNASLPGVSESAVEVSDLDNDGDLDLIIGGYSGNQWNGDGSAFNRNVTLVIENTSAGSNEAPASPQNLSAVASGMDVTFSWDASTDDLTAAESLTYNFYLINAEGQYFYYPLADIATGYITSQGKGNVQLNTEWTVKGLAYDDYTWGVQAIDNSFSGSAFTSATFNHLEGGPLNAGIKPVLVYPNPVQGELKLHGTEQVKEVLIFSLAGDKVYAKALVNESSLTLNLAKGVYVLNAVYENGERSSEKIIIE